MSAKVPMARKLIVVELMYVCQYFIYENVNIAKSHQSQNYALKWAKQIETWNVSEKVKN